MGISRQWFVVRGQWSVVSVAIVSNLLPLTTDY